MMKMSRLPHRSGLPADHPNLAEKPNRSLLKPLLMTGVMAATLAGIGEGGSQYIARRWQYDARYTGQSYHGLYPPLAWIQWQKSWGPYDKAGFLIVDFATFGAIALGGLFLVAAASANRKRRAQPHAGVHGTAKFADTAERIKEIGLLPPDSSNGSAVYVGGWEDKECRLHYLRHEGPEHVMAVAPTRSGKGIGLILPTLLSWKHSAVIHDMKGELWAQTSGWRKQHAGNRVLRFDPASPTGSCNYNILAEVRLGTIYEVSDVQNLVNIVVDPDGKGIEGDHWAGTAHSLLSGLIIHLLHNAAALGMPTPCLFDVGFALANPEQSDAQLWDEMIANRHLRDERGNPLMYPIVAQTGRDMKALAEEERSSVLSTTKRFLGIYRDPLVHENIKRSDFLAHDLANADTPVSLYLVVRPADKDRLRPVIRLLINQIMRVLTRDELKFDSNNRPIMPHKHKLLMMMDEFPAFKRLEVFEESLAFVAGYGIKCYIICQDFSQLWKSYGEHESITANCHIRSVYAPNTEETKKRISDMTGTMTVNTADVSESGKSWGNVDGVSMSYHQVSRPLLTPDEVGTMKAPKKDDKDQIIEPGDMLVFTGGNNPIYGTQILYFRDPVFVERSRMAPVEQTDVVRVQALNAEPRLRRSRFRAVL